MPLLGHRPNERRASMSTTITAQARPARQDAQAASRPGNHIVIVLFMLSLTIPPEVWVELGPIRLPVYRILLVVMAFPCLISLLRGRQGGLNLADFLVFGFALWAAIALLVNHGVSWWQFIGLTTVETVVPYLIARTYIQTAQQFEAFVKLYFIIVLAILPFALIETLTGHHILREIAGQIFGRFTAFEGRPARLGLERAYGPFEHPIHYGLFCATLVGMLVSMQKTRFAALWRYAVMGVAIFCSLSSGPLLLFMVQTQLKIYDVLTRGLKYRWRILSGLVLALYFIVDSMTNRTPFHVIVTYMTLRMESAYNRIHIFDFGMASVEKYPIFGIGLNEWERPPWMSSSVDNFWLVIAMRYGVPAFILFVLALTVIFVRLSRARLQPEQERFRIGWSISMVGMIFAGATVHFWTELYALFMFMVGASYWMVVQSRRAQAADPAQDDAAETAASGSWGSRAPRAGRWRAGPVNLGGVVPAE
ncbi:hypothetical protein DLJ53_24470 [Acuticoccus sediminis]|uniref:O-antigen ligase n=2 Tax=Acuticoccus sediminis TaxID=2184697 RepID=A0A8B2NT79_9HYPH|nr:hypothetical protein DLJ53_24470 [Acuticoccus sediminis]